MRFVMAGLDPAIHVFSTGDAVSIVGWAKARQRRAHHHYPVSRSECWVRFALPTLYAGGFDVTKNKRITPRMPHPLDSFFAPQSIALIGASRDLDKIPGRLLSMLRKNEYPGRIYPINPNYGDIDGLKCYKTIAEVGAPIDLAIIIIPARAVVGALEQCADVGVKNAVI